MLKQCHFFPNPMLELLVFKSSRLEKAIIFRNFLSAYGGKIQQKLVDEISLNFPELVIIGKYVKISFKNKGSPCGYLYFPAPGPLLGSRTWYQICIYRPWYQICIYRPWPPICIYWPWPMTCTNTGC